MENPRPAFFFSITLSFLCLITLCFSAQAAPGDLDTTFGTNGKVITSFSATNDWVENIAIQSDGKIVAVGRIAFQPGVTSSFGVARFNSNGTLDTTFGNGGSVTTSFGTQFAWAYGVAIQSDGKILACGTAASSGGLSHIVVAHYHTDGSLDSGFSLDGKAETPMGQFSSGNAIVVQPDDKIVVVGSTGREIAVVRYNSDGVPDRRFGNRGKVITSIGIDSDVAFGVKIQPDGKLIVAGYTISQNRNFFAIVRYQPHGKVDTSFDFDGIQTTSFSQQGNIAFDLELQTDGKIIVGGYTGTGLFALARYNSNGSLDNTFDGDGKVTTETGGLEKAWHMILRFNPTGKLIAAGSIRDFVPPAYPDFLIIRYNSDGSLDNNFGTAGRVRTPVSSTYDEIWALAIQENGRIVVGGFATNQSEISDFALARYLAE